MHPSLKHTPRLGPLALRRLCGPLALAAVLVATGGPAQARERWAVDLAVGLNLPHVQLGVTLPASAVSVRVGNAHYRHHRGQWYRPRGAQWVLTLPPLGVVVPITGSEAAARPLPGQPSRTSLARPDPVFVPLRDQGPAQQEADRRECNRLATTQAAAMADAAVFHRSVLDCMLDRGYGVD